MIRVLHIIKTLRLGGAETNLLNLIEAMDASRFENFVAYSAGGELEDRFIKAGVKLFKFADGDHKLKSFATFSIVGRLTGFIRSNHIDIVHTHTFNAHIWGGLAAKLAGVKLLEHVHDFRYLEPKEFFYRRGVNRQYWSVKYLKNFSDRVIVLTQQNRDFLIKHGLYSSDRIFLQRNGIPLMVDGATSASLELRDKFGIPRDAVLVLTSVRFAPEKNVDLILRIAPAVIAVCPQTVFVLAGDGPLLEELKQEVVSKKLEDNVKFIGFQSDVRGLLAMSDIFLLPSFLELHSIALLEAMSMAKPVVISRDVGCHSEFIQDGANGLLLDPFCDAGWAEAINRLVANPDQPCRLGVAALETCRTLFDIRDVVKRLEYIYSDLAIGDIQEIRIV